MTPVLSRQRVERIAARAVVAPAPPERRLVPSVLTLRLATCCAFLFLLAFSQDPGKVSRDTKLDLVVDPVGFLTRALSLWDDSSAFGQLQNQAYGYLFPMGPFFAFADLLGLEAWVAQRLWMGLLMTVAFLGVYVLAGRMGIGTPLSRVIAAFAFALTPRLATVLGPISSEALPMCVAPWTLVPLVKGAATGSERRAGLLSALAFACCGAVNAAATLAVLPLPAVYLLTRARGPRKRRLVAWWAAGILLVSLWWAVPLLTLGAYSFPFLDYIETSDITTAGTSLVEVLRGGSHWLAGLVAEGAPWWRAGWLVETAPGVVIASCVVAGIGLAGIARRTTPERLFLACSLMVGALLVTFGYQGPVGPLGASVEADLLDGFLAPFRNVHKFDVVLRVPLALGVAALLASVRRPAVRPLVHLATAGAVAVTASPFLVGAIEPGGTYRSVPGYWSQAAAWLDDNASGTSLLLPAAGFGEYYWGRPMDDPLQPLARSPWAVRNQIPLGSEGSTRLLDAVQGVLNDGRGSPGLAETLRRAGVTHLVLRNDLEWARVGAPRPLLVHAALESSGGFRRVASFGPGVAANRVGPQQVSAYGSDPLFPAVEVFAVRGAADRVQTYDADDIVGIVGGPEAVLEAAAAGSLRGRAAVLTGDPLARSVRESSVVISDAARARKVNFGAVYDNATATLASQDPPSSRRREDFLPWSEMPRTVAAYRNGSVTASSSAADPDAVLTRGPEYSAFAAFDDNLDSAWVSAGRGRVEGEGLTVRFEHEVDTPTVRAAVLDTTLFGARTTALRVRTDAGAALTRLGAGEEIRTLRVPPGPTDHVSVEIAAARRLRAGPVAVGLRELDLGPDTPKVTYVLPAPPPGVPTSAVLVRRSPGERPGCVRAVEGRACSPDLERLGEESGSLSRTFRLAAPLAASARGWAVPRRGPELLTELRRLTGRSRVLTQASSTLVGEPSSRAEAVTDGDVQTSWVASHQDRRPTLVLRWRSPRTVDRFRLLSSPSPSASRPRQVRILAGGLRLTSAVDDDGWVQFPAVRTRQLMLRFPKPEPVFTADPRSHGLTLLPVGIAEIQVPAISDLVSAWDRDAPFFLPCGAGPSLEVDGRQVPTTVTGSVGDLMERSRVFVRACDTVVLAPGRHAVEAPDEWLRIDRLALVGDRATPPTAQRHREIVRQGGSATVRHLALGAGGRTVVGLGENYNAGWVASMDGTALRPVRLDGWQQGFVVHEGAAGVLTLEYEPNRTYRLGLVAGLVALLAASVLLLLPGRSRRPAAGPALLGRWAVSLIALGSLVALAGPVGGLLGGLTLLVARWRPAQAWADWVPLVAASGCALAGVLGAFGLYGADPLRTTATAAQVLAVVALASVWSTFWWDASGASPRLVRPRLSGDQSL